MKRPPRITARNPKPDIPLPVLGFDPVLNAYGLQHWGLVGSPSGASPDLELERARNESRIVITPTPPALHSTTKTGWMPRFARLDAVINQCKRRLTVSPKIDCVNARFK